MLTFSVELKQLERTIRHIIYRDLEASFGSDFRYTKAARKLMMAGCSLGEPKCLPLGSTGLGLDSLATLSTAAAVARFFDMGTSGLDDYLMFDESVGDWSNRVAQHIDMVGSEAVLAFQTSGSTDTPKLVRKSFAELQFEVDALCATVLPDVTTRIIAAVPPHHIFGWLFTVVLPTLREIQVNDVLFRGSASTMEQLETGDFVVGTPFNWQAMLSTGRQFPAGVCGVTAAGPMPSRMREQLMKAGLSRLFEVFGSTETGGIGWRSDSGSSFTLLPHCERHDDQVSYKHLRTHLSLQDHLVWCNAHQFTPVGRIDRAVQIAGVNVSLSKVRDVLCANDLVFDASVRLSGDRLKAFVVPAKSMAPANLRLELDAHVREHLDPPAHPATYTFGDALPRNVMGKTSDW